MLAAGQQLLKCKHVGTQRQCQSRLKSIIKETKNVVDKALILVHELEQKKEITRLRCPD